MSDPETSSDKSLVCSECGLCFMHKSSLKRHELSHSKRHRFICTMCGLKFTREDNLKTHILGHSGVKPFICSICGSGFTHSKNLKQHILTHKGERKLKCSFCDARFIHRASLARHKLMHTGEKPFKCSCCPAEFFQVSLLKRHLLAHTGEKPFVCAICGNSFFQKCDLSRHLLLHKNRQSNEPIRRGRPKKKRDISSLDSSTYLFESVEENSNNLENVRKYQEFVAASCFGKQVKEKAFKCPICGNGFCHKGDLSRHLLLHKNRQSNEPIRRGRPRKNKPNITPLDSSTYVFGCVEDSFNNLENFRKYQELIAAGCFGSHEVFNSDNSETCQSEDSYNLDYDNQQLCSFDYLEVCIRTEEPEDTMDVSLNSPVYEEMNTPDLEPVCIITEVPKTV